MLVDTDVLIWNFRGHEAAADLLDGLDALMLSAVTYMELVQGMRDKSELRLLRQSLRHWNGRILQIDESISSRATFLVEQYALSDGMRVADALIAASALEHGLALLTGNGRHYRCIEGLTLQIFQA